MYQQLLQNTSVTCELSKMRNINFDTHRSQILTICSVYITLLEKNKKCYKF